MDKDNPACYECPQTKNKLHKWQVHRTIDGKVLAANCVYCDLMVSRDHALEIGFHDR